MLYDEISEKTKATALFLELSQNHRNLQQLIGNGNITANSSVFLSFVRFFYNFRFLI